MDKLYILWKRMLSYRTTKWVLSDYPIRITEQEQATTDIPRYRALILQWILFGFGETRKEALADLKKNFDQFLDERPEEVPRPGVMMPLESYFASHEGIDRHSQTADRFTELVLGFEPGSILFISDVSTLSDFEDAEKPSVDFIGRTKDVFGVDISDIEDGNLLRIFQRIDQSTHNSGDPQSLR